MISNCQVCDSENLIFADTGANGGYGPELLPGTGAFKPARFRIVVCEKCGFVHFFVIPEDLDKVKKSRRFRSINELR
ncbi:MAG: hypothetical protein QM401_01395 [Bacillota bacterium]|nr:hypothetical protein [Bacillota bacterium]